MDLVELHDRSGRRFGELVQGVSPDQWHNVTPCTEWDVRTLIHHLLEEQLWVRPLFEGQTIDEVGDRFEGDLLGGDASAWAGLVTTSIEDAHAAVAQPGARERTVHLSFGDVPGEEYILQLTADLAIHGWDLARATGQGEAIDRDVVALLLPWVEANVQLLTGSGLFGTPVDPGPEATDEDRLLGLVGRSG